MNHSKYDYSDLRRQSGEKYAFPDKAAIIHIFNSYGFTNEQYASEVSCVSKDFKSSDADELLETYQTMRLAFELKCPASRVNVNNKPLEEKQVNFFLSEYEKVVKHNLTRKTALNWAYIVKYVANEAHLLKWVDSSVLLDLVDWEIANPRVNPSNVYQHYDEVMLEDLYPAIDRTIEYIEKTYPDKKQYKKDPIESIVDDGISIHRAILGQLCSAAFHLENNILPAELETFYYPKLDKYFKEHCLLSPASGIFYWFKKHASLGNEGERRYLSEIEAYYNSLSFPECFHPSNYLVAQYLYSVLTRKIVRDTLPIEIGALIADLMSTLGYLVIKDISTCSNKEKFDAVKRFLDTDKSTGVYKRIK